MSLTAVPWDAWGSQRKECAAQDGGRVRIGAAVRQLGLGWGQLGWGLDGDYQPGVNAGVRVGAWAYEPVLEPELAWLQ